MKQKILIMQTAFIGDVILATALIEDVKKIFPQAQIDFLLRNGNESLLFKHPHIHQLWIWNKHKNKWKNLFALLKKIRNEKYNLVLNPHRHLSSGILTAFSLANQKIGFKSNPLSIFFSKSYPYKSQHSKHEIERNALLLSNWKTDKISLPKLYPLENDKQIASTFLPKDEFITFSPSSVWDTKRLPIKKWVELSQLWKGKIFILGSKNDWPLAEDIIQKSENKNIENLCGKLNLMASAAFMPFAKMNYVNDSAPLHLCIASNAPVKVFFCSTSPLYGFGAFGREGAEIESQEKINCKPCGVHGRKKCPKGHFNCGNTINIENHLLPYN